MKEDAFAEFDPTADFTEARAGGLSVGVPGTVRGWETALKRYGTKRLSSLLRPAERDRPQGLPHRRDLQPAGHRQRRPVRRLHRQPRALPDARADRQAGRQRPAQPGHGEDLRAHRRGPGQLLRGPDRPRHLAGRPAPAGRAGLGSPAPDPRGLDDAPRPRALRRDPPRPDEDRLPRARHLRHGAAVLRRLHDRRGAEHHGGLPAHRGRAPTSCTSTCRRPSSPTRTAASTSATPPTSSRPSRCAACCPTASPPSGARWSTRPRRPRWRRPATRGPTTAAATAATARPSSDDEGPSTTHLTVADRWGNVVTYTFTIEQIGGSGITVPGRGFLLNNELTDFNFTTGTANSPAPGKRPRSSMAPTMVFDHGRPVLALGSPGGSTIITTVLQILVNKIDFGMSLPDALAAPRASQRNSATSDAEPAFLAQDGAALEARGHVFKDVAVHRRGDRHRVPARRSPAGRRRADAPRRRVGDGGAAPASPRAARTRSPSRDRARRRRRAGARRRPR